MRFEFESGQRGEAYQKGGGKVGKDGNSVYGAFVLFLSR